MHLEKDLKSVRVLREMDDDKTMRAGMTFQRI